MDSIEELRDILTTITDVKHELLAELSRHALAVAVILSGFYNFFEDSRPGDPANIRNYMTREMNALWDIRNILLEDLRLYDDERFRTAMSQGTEEIKGVIYDELDTIRRNVKRVMADAVRAAWDDLSSEDTSSKRRVESRSAAVQCLDELAQSWSTLSEQLSSAQQLWNLGRQA
jgi:hypothetical protein